MWYYNFVDVINRHAAITCPHTAKSRTKDISYLQWLSTTILPSLGDGVSGGGGGGVDCRICIVINIYTRNGINEHDIIGFVQQILSQTLELYTVGWVSKMRRF